MASAAADAAGDAGKGNTLFWVIMGILTVVVVVGATAVGVQLGGTPLPDADLGAPGIKGSILFSDADNNDVADRINPTHAHPRVEGAAGTASAIQWWITTAQGDTVLFEGSGADAEGAFAALKEIGEDATYRMHFRVEDESGAVYVISGNFRVMELQNSPDH